MNTESLIELLSEATDICGLVEEYHLKGCQASLQKAQAIQDRIYEVLGEWHQQPQSS